MVMVAGLGGGRGGKVTEGGKDMEAEGKAEAMVGVRGEAMGEEREAAMGAG